MPFEENVGVPGVYSAVRGGTIQCRKYVCRHRPRQLFYIQIGLIRVPLVVTDISGHSGRSVLTKLRIHERQKYGSQCDGGMAISCLSSSSRPPSWSALNDDDNALIATH